MQPIGHPTNLQKQLVHQAGCDSAIRMPVTAAPRNGAAEVAGTGARDQVRRRGERTAGERSTSGCGNCRPAVQLPRFKLGRLHLLVAPRPQLVAGFWRARGWPTWEPNWRPAATIA